MGKGFVIRKGKVVGSVTGAVLAASIFMSGCGSAAENGSATQENADQQEAQTQTEETVEAETDSEETEETADAEPESEATNEETEDITEEAEADFGTDIDLYNENYQGSGSYPIVADFNQDGTPEIFVFHEGDEGLSASLITTEEGKPVISFDECFATKGDVEIPGNEYHAASFCGYSLFYGHKDGKPSVIVETGPFMSYEGTTVDPYDGRIYTFYADDTGSMTYDTADGKLSVSDIEKLADVCSLYTNEGFNEVINESLVYRGITMDEDVYNNLLMTTKANDALLDADTGLVLYRCFDDFDKDGKVEGFYLTEIGATDLEDIIAAGPYTAKLKLYYSDTDSFAVREVEGGGQASFEEFTYDLSPTAFMDALVFVIDTEDGKVFNYSYESSWEEFNKFYGVKDGEPYEIPESEAPEAPAVNN